MNLTDILQKRAYYYWYARSSLGTKKKRENAEQIAERLTSEIDEVIAEGRHINMPPYEIELDGEILYLNSYENGMAKYSPIRVIPNIIIDAVSIVRQERITMLEYTMQNILQEF